MLLGCCRQGGGTGCIACIGVGAEFEQELPRDITGKMMKRELRARHTPQEVS